jgi:hypothetical protein
LGKRTPPFLGMTMPRKGGYSPFNLPALMEQPLDSHA